MTTRFYSIDEISNANKNAYLVETLFDCISDTKVKYNQQIDFTNMVDSYMTVIIAIYNALNYLLDCKDQLYFNSFIEYIKSKVIFFQKAISNGTFGSYGINDESGIFNAYKILVITICTRYCDNDLNTKISNANKAFHDFCNWYICWLRPNSFDTMAYK